MPELYGAPVLAEIRNAVLSEVCPESSLMSATAKKERSKRLDKANAYCDAFMNRMQTDEPFESVDEAICEIAPIAIGFLWWAARQFAIFVIKSLWRHWMARSGGVGASVLVTCTSKNQR